MEKEMIFYDQYDKVIDHHKWEADEQRLAQIYIQEEDVVLELGARYGTVSCIINKKLNNKLNQVSVDPDARIWDSLEKNMKINDCNFHIVKGFVSNVKHNIIKDDSDKQGYGTTSIIDITNSSILPSWSLDEIKKMYNLKFNVLVADCEGFLETFFDENPEFYDELRMIMFEADYPKKCNYTKIRAALKAKGFTEVVGGFQNVWIKNEN